MLFAYKFLPEEVAKLSRKYDTRHFGALRAHWTRGTYGEPLIKVVLSKDDAIKMMQVGFTPEQIREKYPQWRPHEIGALRAHVTMRTYARTK
jgi:hypothetical protein